MLAHRARRLCAAASWARRSPRASPLLVVLLAACGRGRRERELGQRAGRDALVRRRTSAGSRSASGRRRFRSAASWPRSRCPRSRPRGRAFLFLAALVRRRGGRRVVLRARARGRGRAGGGGVDAARPPALAARPSAAASTSSRRWRCIGFVVLFLHDERGLSDGAAARRCSRRHRCSRSAMRIGVGPLVGRRSASRVGPLRADRRRGRPCAVGVVAVARRRGRWRCWCPALVRRRRLSMAWNGLSFTAAAELAGAARAARRSASSRRCLSAIGVVVPVRSPRPCRRPRGRRRSRSRRSSRSRAAGAAPAPRALTRRGCLAAAALGRHYGSRREPRARAARRALRDRRRAGCEPGRLLEPRRTRRTSSPRGGCARRVSRSSVDADGNLIGRLTGDGAGAAGGLDGLAPRLGAAGRPLRRPARRRRRAGGGRAARAAAAHARCRRLPRRGARLRRQPRVVCADGALPGTYVELHHEQGPRLGGRPVRRSASSPGIVGYKRGDADDRRSRRPRRDDADGRSRGRARCRGRGDPARPRRGARDRRTRWRRSGSSRSSRAAST